MSAFLFAMSDEKKFIDSYRWKKKREEQLRTDHYECQRCKHQGKYKSLDGVVRYTRATLVHHDFRYQQYPQYALMSKVNGKRNLYSLCHNCHEIEHEQERGIINQEKDFNEERW